MGSILHIKSNDAIKKLQPDGILFNATGRTIQHLKFMHTGDLWPDSLTKAQDIKSAKYENLKTQLQLLYPLWTITVIPFIIGSRSYIDETDWSRAWADIHLEPPALRKLIPKVQAWNVEAAREMLAVQATIKKGNG